MREDALITEVQTVARLDASDDDYTSARIRTELTKALHLHFGVRVTDAQSGCWIKRYDTTITSTKTRYRMPYRSMAVYNVQELDSNGYVVRDKDQVVYVVEGDQIVFGAALTQTTLRQLYYLRPSTLVQYQSAGAVTAVDTDALTVTVNTVPIVDRVTGSNVASGDKIDIVHANGWHELSVVGVAATLASSTFTFPAGTDLSDVEVGDYVRAAEQTDWPCLPDEFHGALANVTAAEILRSRGQERKAEAIMARVMGTEKEPGPIRLFQDMIEPRVKTGRQAVVPTVGVLRGYRIRRSVVTTP